MEWNERDRMGVFAVFVSVCHFCLYISDNKPKPWLYIATHPENEEDSVVHLVPPLFVTPCQSFFLNPPVFVLQLLSLQSLLADCFRCWVVGILCCHRAGIEFSVIVAVDYGKIYCAAATASGGATTIIL